MVVGEGAQGLWRKWALLSKTMMTQNNLSYHYTSILIIYIYMVYVCVQLIDWLQTKGSKNCAFLFSSVLHSMYFLILFLFFAIFFILLYSLKSYFQFLLWIPTLTVWCVWCSWSDLACVMKLTIKAFLMCLLLHTQIYSSIRILACYLWWFWGDKIHVVGFNLLSTRWLSKHISTRKIYLEMI